MGATGDRAGIAFSVNNKFMCVYAGVLSGAPAIVEGLTGLTAFRGFAGTSVLIMVRQL